MDPLMGAVVPMAINFAPRGWYSCEGQLLSIAQNTALFSLLGTNYGGDGINTFALPDLRGRAVIGQGQGPGLNNYHVGQKGGHETTTMSITQMPVHNHAVIVHANVFTADNNDPTNNYFGGGGPNNFTASAPDAVLNAAGVVAAYQGGSQPFEVLNPYVAMFYNIAFSGIYPTRN
jgi:microcystin-dependent protein